MDFEWAVTAGDYDIDDSNGDGGGDDDDDDDGDDGDDGFKWYWSV